MLAAVAVNCQFIKRSFDHLPSRYTYVSKLFTKHRKFLVFATSLFLSLGIWLYDTSIVFRELFTLFVPQALSARICFLEDLAVGEFLFLTPRVVILFLCVSLYI